MTDKRPVFVATRDNSAFKVSEETRDRVKLTNINTGRSHWVSKDNLAGNYCPTSRDRLQHLGISEGDNVERRLKEELPGAPTLKRKKEVERNWKDAKLYLDQQAGRMARLDANLNSRSRVEENLYRMELTEELDEFAKAMSSGDPDRVQPFLEGRGKRMDGQDYVNAVNITLKKRR